MMLPYCLHGSTLSQSAQAESCDWNRVRPLMMSCIRGQLLVPRSVHVSAFPLATRREDSNSTEKAAQLGASHAPLQKGTLTAEYGRRIAVALVLQRRLLSESVCGSK